MTIFITVHENTPARLIWSETRTTDYATAELVMDYWRGRGFFVDMREER